MSRILWQRWLWKNWQKPVVCLAVFYTFVFVGLYYNHGENVGEHPRHYIQESKFLKSAKKELENSEKIAPKLSKQITSTKQYNQTIVHFDLKGAAPNVGYFIEVLNLISKNGATGILIEYEDMFPFEGPLSDAVNSEAYSKKELVEILTRAKSLNLTIIPLIQSFGHLEWVLKLPQYKKYRDYDIAVVCITQQEAVTQVVEPAFVQILEFHKQFGVELVHIGGDEAFDYGRCFPTDKSRADYAANYLNNLANFVRQLTGPSTRVLAWNDMIDLFWHTSADIRESIELVVWDYGDLTRFKDFYWKPKTEPINLPIWGASAFKGADGADQLLAQLDKRTANNLIWASTKRQYIPKDKFGGLILTGWQRYDHFSSFCEILPFAMPSLIVNLKIASGMDNKTAVAASLTEMGCADKIDASFDGLEKVLRVCNYPGADVYRKYQEMMLEYDTLVDSTLNSHQRKGWLRYYNQHFEFSHKYYMQILVPLLHEFVRNVQAFGERMDAEVSKYLVGSAGKEFVFNMFAEDLDKVKKMIKSGEKLQSTPAFQKRPFNFEL